jgi:hypothetical protein
MYCKLEKCVVLDSNEFGSRDYRGRCEYAGKCEHQSLKCIHTENCFNHHVVCDLCNRNLENPPITDYYRPIEDMKQ